MQRVRRKTKVTRGGGDFDDAAEAGEVAGLGVVGSLVKGWVISGERKRRFRVFRERKLGF